MISDGNDSLKCIKAMKDETNAEKYQTISLISEI